MRRRRAGITVLVLAVAGTVMWSFPGVAGAAAATTGSVCVPPPPCGSHGGGGAVTGGGGLGAGSGVLGSGTSLGSPPGALAFTGVSIGILIMIAAALLLIGLWTAT